MTGDSTIGRFHHVGVAVRSIDAAAETMGRQLGAGSRSEIVHDPVQGVRVCFLSLGESRIELIEPAAEPSPIDGVLKRGMGLYHVCYEVDDLDAALARLRADGAALVAPPQPAAAFGGRRIAFVMSCGLLVELLESGAGGQTAEPGLPVE